MEKDIIKSTFEKNNIQISDAQLEMFCAYYKNLIKWNNIHNLTNIIQIEDVACKHFVDSVIGYQNYAKNSLVLDIGTGAGFPGIPIKILRPDLEVILVDSLQKRIDFLEDTIKLLNLDKISCIHSRAQDLKKVPRGTCALVFSRALAPLNMLVEMCVPYLKIGGKMVAFKGGNVEEEIDNSKHALRELNCANPEVFKTTIFDIKNNSYERSILTIKKLAKTPQKYPRGKNLIKTQPL